MSPAELPKGSVPGAFFRKVGKPEFAKATPAARYLSWLLLGVGDTSEQALAACGPRFGARDPCAGRSPPGARAIRARIAHRRTLRLPGWLFGAFRRYSAGRGQAAAAPLSAPRGTGAGRPYPVNPIPGQVQPVYAQRPPHCSRRSRLKFFAKLFFKKAGKGVLKRRAGLRRVRPPRRDRRSSRSWPRSHASSRAGAAFRR